MNEQTNGAPQGAVQREVLPEVRFTARLAALGVADGMDMDDFGDVLVFEADPQNIRAAGGAFNKMRSFLSGPLADASGDLLEIAKTSRLNVLSLHGRNAVTEAWLDELERVIALAEGGK